MTASTQANPSLGAFTAGYDPVAHTTGVALRVANIQTDTSVTPNVTYGDLGVDVTVSISPTANQRVNAQSGDFVDGAIATIGAKADARDSHTDATAITVMQVLKQLSYMLQNPAALPANQSINNAQVAGTSLSVNAGTSDAGTQRVVNATASTGTKSNVPGNASSVTILAANTSRKGAIIYNDSTALLYLDLSGGTASSTSYSVQVPSQSFFELPGPIVYNGAITGIWVSTTGNARVTEFS